MAVAQSACPPIITIQSRNRSIARIPYQESPSNSTRLQNPDNRSWTLAQDSESPGPSSCSSNLRSQPIEYRPRETLEPSQFLFGELDCIQGFPNGPDVDCQANIYEGCSECEQICEDCVTDCDSDCGVSSDCDGVDCTSDPCCDMCDVNHSKFDLLGPGESLFSPLTSTLWDVGCADIGESGGIFEDTSTTHHVDLSDAGDSPASGETDYFKNHARALEVHMSKVATDHYPAPLQDQFRSPCKFPPNLAVSTFGALGALEIDARRYSVPAPSFPTMTRFPPAQCQWNDPIGGLCGRKFMSSDHLHDHLRVTHGVASEVFCRWTGCRCGHTTTLPHRFAGGVLRHTWGHSGYRPYKCLICRVGFAAADVRDEHVANVHMGQKLYSCEVPGCTHECSGISNLRRHKRDKHGAEQFQCEFCNWNGKRRLFPRAQNLRRHFRTCKFVLANFPAAHRAASGKEMCKEWFPPGYGPGHRGMNRARVMPPNYL